MRQTAILAFVFGVMLPLTASAQYEQGMISLGGTASLYGGDRGHLQSGAFSISPSVGYSYSDQSMVGGTIGYGRRYSHSPGAPTRFSTDLSIGPFWRYNYPVSAQAGVYGSVSPNFSYSKSEYYDDYYWALNMSGAAGAYYFVTPKISLQISVGSLSYGVNFIKIEGDPIRASQNWNLSLYTSGVGLSLFYHI